jgi:hypothetical protein
MLQDVLQKSRDGLAAPRRRVASCLDGTYQVSERRAYPVARVSGFDLPLREYAGAENGSATADSGDRTRVRYGLPQDLGLLNREGWKLGRSLCIGFTGKKSWCSGISCGEAVADRCIATMRFRPTGIEPSVESGFRVRPVDRWATVPSVNDSGCVYVRGFGHRGRAKVEGQIMDLWVP